MKIGIIGTGKHGTLMANLFVCSENEVLVFDRTPCEFLNKHVIQASLEEVLDVQFLFIAIPVEELEQCCQDISDLLSPQTVVLDIAPVKMYTVSIMRRRLNKAQPIIATHPLFGPSSVSQLGVQGQTLVACPVRVSELQGEAFEKLIKNIGLRLVYTTPDEHDRQMADANVLLHLISRSYQEVRANPRHDWQLPAVAFFEQIVNLTTEDSWQRFYDLQKYNPFAKESRAAFLQSVQRHERQIENTGERGKSKRVRPPKMFGM